MAASKKMMYFVGPGGVLFTWDPAKGEQWAWDDQRLWHRTTAVTEYLYEGDITWLDDISEADARERFPEAFTTSPEGDADGRFDGLTAEEISSIAARAMGNDPSPFEEIMEDNEIPESCLAEARALYDGVRRDWANMPKNATMSLPNEWT